MLKNKFKFLSLFISYSFFIGIIIISINAVVPDAELPVLEPKEILVEKIDNDFFRNKNSAYEILEENNDNEIIENKNEETLKKKIKKVETKKSNDQNNKFRLQFASFKQKQKSLKISNELKTKFSKMEFSINLTIKKVKINDKETFFRIISEDKFSFLNASNQCKLLKNKNIQCIIIKS